MGVMDFSTDHVPNVTVASLTYPAFLLPTRDPLSPRQPSSTPPWQLCPDPTTHSTSNDRSTAAHMDAGPWLFCQIQYNYLDTAFQAGTAGLNLAAERGLAVMIMEPLRGGELANAMPQDIQAVFDASGRPWSRAAWALRWLWNHPAVTVVLSGMRSVSDLNDNVATAAEAEPGTFTAADQTVIDRVAGAFAARMTVPCTGCGYCMPCPAGVDHSRLLCDFKPPQALRPPAGCTGSATWATSGA